MFTKLHNFVARYFSPGPEALLFGSLGSDLTARGGPSCRCWNCSIDNLLDHLGRLKFLHSLYDRRDKTGFGYLGFTKDDVDYHVFIDTKFFNTLYGYHIIVATSVIQVAEMYLKGDRIWQYQGLSFTRNGIARKAVRKIGRVAKMSDPVTEILNIKAMQALARQG